MDKNIPTIIGLAADLSPDFLKSINAENAMMSSSQSYRFDVRTSPTELTRVKVTVEKACLIPVENVPSAKSVKVNSYRIRTYRIVEAEDLPNVEPSHLQSAIKALLQEITQ